MIPHAFPFRLAERAEPGEGGSTIAVILGTAGGATTPAGPWLATLVAEALAQSVLLVARPRAGGAPQLVGLDGVELLQPVAPGDRLEVAVTLVASFGRLRRYACRAMAAGALAASAEVTVSIGVDQEA